MRTLFIIALVALFTSCSEQSQQQATHKKDIDSLTLTQQQLKGVNVKFVQFAEREIKPVIHANGTIKLLPESKAEVSSHISGKVERIMIREGMFVKAGQALLSISSFELLELQNEYATAKNDAEFLRVEFERQEALQQKKMGVLADYQSAKSKYQSAVIKEKTLKQKLELLGIHAQSFANMSNPDVQRLMVIRAPFDGFVNKLNVHVGSLVETETILAEIINPDALQAEVYVYEKDAEQVTEGLPVQLNFVQSGIAPVQGKILFVSRALDPVNKTITLHVQFAKPKGEQIHADMNVKALITGLSLTKSNRAVPGTAIYDDGTNRFIFITGDATKEQVELKKVRVEVIHEDDSFVVVNPILEIPANCWIADHNVLAIEAERKKNE